MKSIIWLLPSALLLYLLAWPVDIQPVAWTPPPAPSLEQGAYARNDHLRGVQRIAEGAVHGPEAMAFDSSGRLLSGLEDGRVVRMNADGSACQVIGNTGGRPLGIQVQSDGALLIADARKGLLRMSEDGQIDVLATRAEGTPLNFVDDLAVDSRGRILFSDASWKFGYGEHLIDTLEHGARGRLLMYDPAIGDAVTLAAELNFANGVALGPEEQYVLVNETTAYRIARYWLQGDKAGTRETFADNLPGFPDNITFNGRDRFWVALFGPRDGLLDWLLPRPFWRTVVARVPSFLQPAPRKYAFILGLDLEGRVVEQYQYAGEGAFAPVTSVREHDGMLYLGSLSQTAIGRISLDALRSGEVTEPPAPLSSECVTSE